VKQVLQNLGSGETILAEVPQCEPRSNSLLVETSTSLLSIGTEKLLIDFGKAGWIDKARKQPEKVKQVISKIKTDGLFSTLDAVKSKLDQPIALGYCNVGKVIATQLTAKLCDLRHGDRIASNGPHAQVVSVPTNLCAKVPDSISDEEAAFTVVGAIGLQGIRLLGATLGETVVVTGLGLIGLLCVQMLRAQGCRVLGIDFDSSKCDLARQFGAEAVDLSKGEDPISAAAAFTNGRGVDGVLITASTQSNEPVHQAATMCRKRGRIVLVGVVGLQLSRADFYEKELTFQVSCSYGPGRYDENYEQKGHDYPIGFVRWTEQRNFEAVLNLLAEKKLDVAPLISHRFPFEDALKAYECINDKKALGIILQYNAQPKEFFRTVQIHPPAPARAPGEPVIALIGAGNFTGQVLLPALKETNARLKIISSSGGVTGTHLARKYGFELSTTDNDTIFSDPEINTVLVTTRHNTHARFVIEALKAGKNVYVEKPLCLTRGELDQIASAYQNSQSSPSGSRPLVIVGFNRRFAPQVQKIKSLLSAVKEPKTFIMTVNAGAIPANHWTQDPAVGGGRIIGEGCHFVDLLRFLAGSAIVGSQASQIGPFGGWIQQDKISFTLTFEDGSIGTVHYFANGHQSFPKERLEVYTAGRILQLDNFRKLTGYGWPGFKKMNLWSQDKGHKAEMAAWINSIRYGKPAPIPFQEIIEVTQAILNIVEQAQQAK